MNIGLVDVDSHNFPNIPLYEAVSICSVWSSSRSVIKICQDFNNYEPYAKWTRSGCPVPGIRNDEDKENKNDKGRPGIF